MGRVASAVPEQLCFRWWVVPPFLGGAVLAAGLVLLSLPASLPGCLHGGLLTAFGALLVWARAGRIIDRGRGVVTEWWGIPLPIRRREVPLAAFDAVTVSSEASVSGDDSYTAFLVCLTGPASLRVGLDRGRDLYEARKVAGEVADFVGLVMVDRSLEEA